MLWLGLALWLPGCAPAAVVEAGPAQAAVKTAWQADQHGLWVIDWPNAPLAGPVTVEVWRQGQQRRYEILEAAPAGLVGQTLVLDGRQAWRYNRFEPPETFSPTTARLSPVTETVALVEQLLNRPASRATRQAASVNSAPAQKITLSYANADQLQVWLAADTGLPLRLDFMVGAQTGRLEVRRVEPLLEPPPALFSVGPWLRSR